MRLGGLFLLLILSYFFNPIKPIVDDIPVKEVTQFEQYELNLQKDLDEILAKTDCAMTSQDHYFGMFNIWM